jgi:hypothetical protein
VTVEGLDAREDFAVVAARDQDLRARANGGLEDGQRSSGKLMLLDLRDFVFSMQQSEPECYMGDGKLVDVRQLLSRLCEQLPATR